MDVPHPFAFQTCIFALFVQKVKVSVYIIRLKSIDHSIFFSNYHNFETERHTPDMQIIA